MSSAQEAEQSLSRAVPGLVTSKQTNGQQTRGTKSVSFKACAVKSYEHH